VFLLDVREPREYDINRIEPSTLIPLGELAKRVGELPTGATAGLGARLLTGSYYGQTVQIWSALLMAALLGCILVLLIGFTERMTQRQMGARP